MDKSPNHIVYLWQQYIAGRASAEELDELLKYNNEVGDDETQSSIPEEILAAYPPKKFLDNEVQERILRGIVGEGLQHFSPPVQRVHFLNVRWVRYAIAVVLILAIGTFFWTTFNNKSIPPPEVAIVNDEILPGRDGAILTLEDGSQVVLDSLGNGVIADQNGSRLILKNGQLAYYLTEKASEEVVYNTMATPKGRQFQVTLPDGTRVWLNSASSISFPTVFIGKERKVIITGEVYFEVTKNTRMPFRVNIDNKAVVEVLGTHFNVNAYENEDSINTTLLEGSIRINEVAIRPGQQAKISITGVSGDRKSPGTYPVTVVSNANIENIMAWKNGLFNFNGADLYTVMRQLERWYDIKVQYEGAIQNVIFKGKMYRNATLSDVLYGLQRLGLKFRVEGKTIIVTGQDRSG